MTARCERRPIRVPDHIHDHPEADLSVDALAGVAAVSRFHGHRMFHAMTGGTPARAVCRARLHRAALWLVEGDRPVVRIAGRVGNRNRHSFSHGFSGAYGLSPAALRRRCTPSAPPSAPSRRDSTMFDLTLKHRPATVLAGLDHTGPCPDISRAFSKVFATLVARAKPGRCGAGSPAVSTTPTPCPPPNGRAAVP